MTTTHETYSDRESVLFDELLCIADSKFILGNWYFITLPNGRSVSDWTALCAMMQNHYGHARALYRYFSRFGFTREEAEWQRPCESIRSLRALDRPPNSWSDFVVTSHLAESAFSAQLKAIAQSDVDSQLARLAAKIGKETQFHLNYFEGWRDILVDGLANSVQDSLNERLPEILEWWGAPNAADPLHVSGWRADSDSSLRNKFLVEIEQGYAPLHLSARVEVSSSTFASWQRSIRRTGEPGIPESLHNLIRFKEPELAVP